MNIVPFCIALCLLLPSSASLARTRMRVVTTTTDLKCLAEVVGGSLVDVESLSTGDQDLHFVEPRPSMVMKVRKADVFIKVGMDLDMWADSLLAAARNGRVVFGAPGHVDASVGIVALQVPVGKVDAAMGDIHTFGNPHYWLDPVNASVITWNIMQCLARNDPDNAAAYDGNRKRFLVDLDAKLGEWRRMAAPLKGMKLVTYHESWVYFANRFGLVVSGNLEPKPGIPPSPSHLNRLVSMMREGGVRVVMVESHYPLKGARMVAEKTGAELLVVASSAGGLPGVRGYFDVFDHILGNLSRIGATGGREGAP